MSKRSKDQIWMAEKIMMSKQSTAIYGKRVPIRDAQPGYNGKIPESYLSDEPAIYIANESEVSKGLDEHKRRAYHFGLFAHEIIRLHYTNFNEYYKVMRKNAYKQAESMIFTTIFRICEDGALESCAKTVIGGYLLSSFKYVTKITYDNLPDIDSTEEPFNQVLLAMQHYSTMGLLKGHFKDIVTKRYFYKIIPMMQGVFDEGDPKERVEKAVNVFEALRPLWQPIADKIEESDVENLEDLDLSALLGMMKDLMEATKGLRTKGEKLDPEEMADNVDLSKGAMRKTTWKKLEEMSEDEKQALEEAKKMYEEAKDSKEDMTGLHVPELNDESMEIYSDADIDLSTVADYDPAFDEIDKEACDFFDRLVQSEIEISNVDATPTEDAELPDFKEVSNKYTGRNYSCLNSFVNVVNREEADYYYNKIIKKNAANINNCYKRLKRMFAEDVEEKEYKATGKLSIKRTMSTTVSPKLFTKSVAPKERANIAVTLLIDESGSMHGSRIERAKEAAINLSEILGLLKIPTYVMGFTADTGGYDVVHRHYGTWENKKADRTKLCSIHADADNFDGYSIRYGSKLLSLRPEIHKVLIVISDGQPACYAYNYSTGYNDTKDAIREARGDGQVVLGVAIGADIDVLHNMYGNDFIFINSGDDLFTGIMKKFSEMVRKW